MKVIKFKIDAELKKLAQGKKTKCDPLVLIHASLAGYPKIQRSLAKAAGIRTLRPMSAREKRAWAREKRKMPKETLAFLNRMAKALCG